MASSSARNDPDGLPGKATDLWQLVVAYVKQETLEPIKGVGRYVAFGLAGSLVLATGLVLLFLGALRLLQDETGTTFTGNLSWLPYLITLLACGLVAGAAMKARSRGQRKERA
jgi:lysylphosphatidylglycerol synthetase-like protein (DUF2156 family)